VVAVAMVVGAIQLRQRIDDGADGGNADDSAQTEADPAEIVCATEVAIVCDGVGQTAAAPATAAQVIADPENAPVGVWLTAGPWGEVVNGEVGRRGGQPPFDEMRVVARSPLVAVLHTARAQALRARCPQVTWRCLGDAATELRIGARPASESEGLLVRAAALGGFLENPDYVRNDIDERPEATAWLALLNQSIATAAQGGAPDYQRFLAARGAAAAVFLTTEANAGPPPPGFEVVVPQPRALMDVAVASRRRAPKSFTDRVSTLFQAGWKRPNEPSVRGDDGLPSAGVLQALQEVIR
jgi:hypothetical protein